VSRLNDLLRQLEAKDPALARDLRQEYDVLADRRAFGLNFERHTPEVVELPGRKVRQGDKVHVLPERGKNPSAENSRLWRVVSIDRVSGLAVLEDSSVEPVETVEVALGELVVAAEFRDPIYPGLVSTGKIERGGDKPFHTVINAENYYALQTLLFTHRGQIDCIYIDPPYNTGAKDWKYNNDYVEGDDLYRHSKWLAFMERRLRLAKELLNPDKSALIITIDEKEYLRLGLLLQQVLPDARMQMISTVINPTGAIRTNEFTRVNEFVFVLSIGAMQILPDVVATDDRDVVRWNSLRRFEMSSKRGSRPGQFYGVFVDKESSRIVGVTEALADDVDRFSVAVPENCEAVFPLKPDGTEMIWGLRGESLMSRVASGFAKATPSRADGYSLYYLTSGKLDDISSGEIVVTGYEADGSAVVERQAGVKTTMPLTQWSIPSHNAQSFGTKLISRFIPGRRFPFPKSLYAVEDVLRYFVGSEPEAVVLDFFSGSGTTAHAVMRLNRQDGGARRTIAVTNNEVSAEEQRELRKRGIRPGEADWERLGICEHVTKPRIVAAITGRTPDGDPVNGEYKFADEFPMSLGLEENVEFFTLTYEAPLRVSSNREFAKVAPLLWLRAGSQGRRIDEISAGWDVADSYGVLADLDQTDTFLKAVAEGGDDVCMVFVVTDEDRLFQSVVRELPAHVEAVRLYEAYLRNFEIESGRSML